MTNTNKVKIEKIEATGNWGVMKEMATALGINPFGKSKEGLSGLINTKIDELGEAEVNRLNGIEGEPAAKHEEVVNDNAAEQVTPEGGASQEVNENPEDKPQDEQEPSGDADNGQPEDKGNEDPKGNEEPKADGDGGKDDGNKPEETSTPAATAKKWHEDGYNNKPGDRVTIIGKNIHQSTKNPKVILQGRTAVVVGPSKKANTIQAKLIDDKGNEQQCIITLAFGEYGNEGEIQVDRPERRTRKKAEKPEEVTPAPENTEPKGEETGENPEGTQTPEEPAAGNDGEPKGDNGTPEDEGSTEVTSENASNDDNNNGDEHLAS
ncbi:hypothetical protein D3C81_333560 [compost metagenome]